MNKEHTYTNGEVTIVWKQDLCIHSRKCWKGLPEVFQPGERPWIKPTGADSARIIAQVNQCPSGALSMLDERPSMDIPKSTTTTTIELATNGPLRVIGTITIKHADGRVEIREEKCSLCRCGHSKKKPFCDGSHRGSSFQG